jgi:hypothetical protein
MANLKSKWEEIKVLVNSLDLDIAKQDNGNASAGIRARKGLRLLKNEVAALVKESLETEKDRKSED